MPCEGYDTAWLACAIGNDRAARFYEKSGWHIARTFVSELPVPDGIFPLEVWRYEKRPVKSDESPSIRTEPTSTPSSRSSVPTFPKYFGPDEEPGLRDFLVGPARARIISSASSTATSSVPGGIALNDDDTVSLCWGMIRSDHLGRGLGKQITEFRINAAREKHPTLPLVISTSQHTRGFYENSASA